jgi:aromatic ring-opening dioxygenase LigB subunit
MGVLAPHPPLLIPDIGLRHLRQVKATDEAMRAMADRVVADRPEGVVVISPHSPLLRDAVAINFTPRLSGGFEAFGSDERLDFSNDLHLAEAIAREIEADGVGVVRLSPEMLGGGRRLELDHGVLVPMHYLHRAGYEGPIVAMSMALLPVDRLYAVGKAIQRAVGDDDRRVVVLASGDLSHRLTPDAPAGFDPQGATFDHQLIELLKAGDVAGIMGMDEDLCEAAGECGYRSIIMMLGALDGSEAKPQVLSYEGPFGVGYGVATMTPVSQNSGERSPAMMRSE